MTAKYKRVMIIDDNELDIYITNKLVTNNYLAEQVLEYTSAEEALEYLIGNRDQPENLPNLIFLDIYMPRMDGFEFIDKINELDDVIKSHCTICVVSSTVSHYDIHKVKIEKGIPLFTSKPITKDFIASLIE